jgi:hypothetical protein
MKLGLKIKKSRPKINADFSDLKGDLSSANKQEVGEKLAKIRAGEKKLKEDFAFDLDAKYYCSIVFRSTQERNAFLKKYNVRLEFDDHFIYDKYKHIFVEKK